MAESEPKRALIMSGGGGRGAYHCGVLEYLEIIGWQPDILVGTSIGAINAAAVASGHNAQSLKRVWRGLTTDGVQKLRTDLFDLTRWTYLLDNSPWRTSLTRSGWFDFDRINSDAAPTLAVTATDVYTGALTVFCNRDLEPSKSGGPRSKRIRRVQFTLDHILASCSIPIVYPWTRISEENSLYWDGAVVSNTPLGTALRAGATDIIVILLSPWETDDDAYSYATEGLPRLWSLPGLALDWALLASFRSDLKLCDAVNDFVAAFELLDEGQRQQLAHKLWGKASEQEQARRLEKVTSWRTIDLPRIVAPKTLMPVEQIITYDTATHEHMFEMGRSDAARILRDMTPGSHPIQ
jgi:NTE family protein